MNKSKKVTVIGAGLGGLAISCLLAKEGHHVSVLEKNETPGGKINQIEAQGFRFDTGPSLLTMPFILETLFVRCGVNLDDYLEITPLEPICRYFYKDGTRFDCFQDGAKNLEQIHRFAPEEETAYREFMDYAAGLYRRTKDAFLFNPLYNFSDLTSLNLLDFFQIDALRTVADRVDDYFDSPYLRQFFKRFTTYNGSSPFQAPATLNVIPHVELSLGGYYTEGGMYAIIQALADLAGQLGVEFIYDTEIRHIQVQDGSSNAVITADGAFYSSDLIISNSDASETYLKLLSKNDLSTRKKRSVESLEPSCSGFVLFLGIDREYEQLGHHTIFFSADYEREFRQIFREKVMPEDPTIYIANTSATNPRHAPEGGSNLFILVNAPYLSDMWNWRDREESYADFILSELENRGLAGLRGSVIYQNTLTPMDFREKYRSNKGSIYGTSSNNRLSAFLRPRNKSRQIGNLYLVGGSTHPGGGIPLVILSAFHALELIRRYE